MENRLKGLALFSLAVGLIVLFVGVALMYLLPEYIIQTLNATGVFPNATVVEALAKANQIRGLGFLAIVVAVIWIAISALSSR